MELSPRRKERKARGAMQLTIGEAMYDSYDAIPH
jgi:hypothetical protein